MQHFIVKWVLYLFIIQTNYFAVPGRSEDKYNLIKQQRTRMLTSAADLIYLLDWDVPEKETKTIQK